MKSSVLFFYLSLFTSHSLFYQLFLHTNQHLSLSLFRHISLHNRKIIHLSTQLNSFLTLSCFTFDCLHVPHSLPHPPLKFPLPPPQSDQHFPSFVPHHISSSLPITYDGCDDDYEHSHNHSDMFTHDKCFIHVTMFAIEKKERPLRVDVRRESRQKRAGLRRP